MKSDASQAAFSRAYEIVGKAGLQQNDYMGRGWEMWVSSSEAPEAKKLLRADPVCRAYVFDDR